MKARRALISVYDKTGLVELVHGLVAAGIEIVSSGGTARAIADAGAPVTPVAELTGAPEILGGRVKTLHPKIHGGILADRRNPGHMSELGAQGIAPIDLVVCNLYPFEDTIAHPSVSEDQAVEQIDIGGPAMVRAAAKNFHSVAVVVSPKSYGRVLAEIEEGGEISEGARRELAVEAFRHTALYDAAIADYLSGPDGYPQEWTLAAHKVADLRYGENPHQTAAFYRTGRRAGGLAAADQLHGKELSYNNLMDLDAAWRLSQELSDPAAVVVKHSNPCGVAARASLAAAYDAALRCDPVSAFGGIVAFNRSCDPATAQAMANVFTECVIAPGYHPRALAMLESKRSLRIIQSGEAVSDEVDVRAVSGGLLVQTPDAATGGGAAKVVTVAQPTPHQWTDLLFAWTVAKYVKSNAIVLARQRTAVGVGAGQMNRLQAAELAARRAGDHAFGSVCASDAFFPFRDGLDAAVAAGATAVIQPGGSVRDDEVIAAADEHGIPMVFTGTRHFRH